MNKNKIINILLVFFFLFFLWTSFYIETDNSYIRGYKMGYREAIDRTLEDIRFCLVHKDISYRVWDKDNNIAKFPCKDLAKINQIK